MHTNPPAPRKPTETELTLSGVLQVTTADAKHLPLTEGLQLSMQVIRMVAQAHDQGQVVGVLDAAHLVCSNSGNLAFGGKGGNPIAPELKRGEMPDRLTDVYALGALMYRLLTGRRVDPSTGSGARIIEPPSHFNPAVDSSLDELVLAALDEDPSERPYSARELEQQLLVIYDDLGLEDSRTEATHLLASVKPPKRKAEPAPAPVRMAPPEATIDYDDEDDWQPVIDRNPLEKKWLVGGIAVLVLFLVAFVAWPEKKETPRIDDDAVPAKVTKAPEVIPAPAPAPVQAKLVEPAPEPAKVVKAKKAESPKKSTRRARR